MEGPFTGANERPQQYILLIYLHRSSKVLEMLKKSNNIISWQKSNADLQRMIDLMHLRFSK